MKLTEMLRRNWFAVLLLIIFALYLFFHLQKMNEIGFNGIPPPKPQELYLTSYPKEVAGSSSFTVFSNFNSSCTLCNSSAAQISEGENRIPFESIACRREVSLNCSGLAVSFSFEEVAAAPPETVSAFIQTSVENRSLFIVVSGEARTNGYRPLEIFVDGVRVAAPLYLLNGTFRVSEKIPISQGKHLLEVRFLDRMLASEEIDARASYPLPALFTALLAVAVAFFYKGDVVRRLLAASVLLIASLVVSFRLAGFGLDWLVPLALLAYIIYLAKPGTVQKRQKQDGSAEMMKEAAIFGAAFAAVILIYSLTIADYDIWGAYYFRHAQETFARGTTNYFDELSYLGRPFTYPPVFFEFAAQLTGILAQSSFESIRLPLDILLAFSFAATTYLLFRHMEPKSRILASLMFLSQWAILLTATGIGLHILAFTLLNIAIILIISNPVASIVALGLAFATHPLVLAVFPFYFYAANGFRLDLKRTMAWPVFAVLLSLPFYLPIFMRAGLPYEIVPGRWGYLLSYGIDGMRFDFQFLLPLLAGCALYGILANRHRIPSLLLLGLLIFNTFISLRADLIVAMVGAGLFPLIFKKELKEKWAFPLLLALFILPNFILGAVVLSGTDYYCTWGLANGMCASPMGYISRFTSSDSSVAVDPLYGHLEAWKGGRPVLADLYVEYADYEKWRAEDEFAWNANASAVGKYNITLFVLHDFYKTPRTLPMDRVYDNGFMHIFKQPIRNP